MSAKNYDSTIARMAGNIAAGLVGRMDLLNPHAGSLEQTNESAKWIARMSVGVALEIVRLCKDEVQP